MDTEAFPEYPEFPQEVVKRQFSTGHIEEPIDEGKPPSDGVPHMFYICVGSATTSSAAEGLKHIKGGATIPYWGTFPEFFKLCRAARDERFGPGYLDRISRAIDKLFVFESQVHAQIEDIRDANVDDKPEGKALRKAMKDAKVESRRQAISQMCARQPSSEAFIDHSRETGQAFGGNELSMRLACYGRQGIFGYSNVIVEPSDIKVRGNLNRWRRSSDAFDHRCAEAATSWQCKAETLREAPTEPYRESLPYA